LAAAECAGAPDGLIRIAGTGKVLPVRPGLPLPSAARPRGSHGVITMTSGSFPTLIALPAVSVAF